MVRQAVGREDFLAVGEMSATIFGVTGADRSGLIDGMLARFELQQQGRSKMSTYLALIDGELVGEAQAMVMPSGINLSGSSVLPAARGRGVYRALVSARWDEAVERDLPASTVQAGVMSAPILQRLGVDKSAPNWCSATASTRAHSPPRPRRFSRKSRWAISCGGYSWYAAHGWNPSDSYITSASLFFSPVSSRMTSDWIAAAASSNASQSRRPVPWPWEAHGDEQPLHLAGTLAKVPIRDPAHDLAVAPSKERPAPRWAIDRGEVVELLGQALMVADGVDHVGVTAPQPFPVLPGSGGRTPRSHWGVVATTIASVTPTAWRASGWPGAATRR